MPLAAVCVALIAAFLLRSPSEPPAAPQTSQPQIEQVERALEDMDMLKQMGVASPQELLAPGPDEF